MHTRSPLLPADFTLRTESGTFIDHIGPVWMHRTERGNRLAIVVEKRHTNPTGTTHGGVLASLIDVTMGSSAGIAQGGDQVLATVQLSCNLMAAAKEGELVMTEATVDRVTKTFTFVSGRVTCGDRLLMTATGIFRNPPAAK